MPSINRIRRQQARPGTEHHPSPGMVVQLDDAVRGHQRVMVGSEITPVPKRIDFVRSAAMAMKIRAN